MNIVDFYTKFIDIEFNDNGHFYYKEFKTKYLSNANDRYKQYNELINSVKNDFKPGVIAFRNDKARIQQAKQLVVEQENDLNNFLHYTDVFTENVIVL